MISRLPKWVWMGGAVLAFIAGIINTVGFLSFQHQGVTHLTGTTTALSIAVAQEQWRPALEMIAILVSFVFGATLCGVVVQNDSLQLGRRYGVALIIEALILLLAIPLLAHRNVAGNCLASCACGLQNAMATTYSGAVIRTTHVSGLFTDIGTLIGHRLRGLEFSRPHMKLLVYLLCGFFAGGVFGTFLFSRFNVGTLFFPAGLTGAVGVGYAFYRPRRY